MGGSFCFPFRFGLSITRGRFLFVHTHALPSNLTGAFSLEAAVARRVAKAGRSIKLVFGGQVARSENQLEAEMEVDKGVGLLSISGANSAV